MQTEIKYIMIVSIEILHHIRVHIHEIRIHSHVWINIRGKTRIHIEARIHFAATIEPHFFHRRNFENGHGFC